ncbi:MAG: GAF domain-containing protein [Anaerolineae bacterium]|nr:GAF domain-containing protein [Anaerolineae bacterium]
MTTKILVVDSQPAEMDPTLHWLQQEGYQITLTTKGEPAIQLAEQIQPDLIFIDTAMPDVDGVDLCRLVRRTASLARIPVILISSHVESEARAESIRAGADAFVTRPVQTGQVRRHLNAIFNVVSVALDENRRLLLETCQAALTILPCNLAWLLVAESTALYSRAIASEHGPSAGEVFLRLAAGNDNPSLCFTLSSRDNPLSDAALGAAPIVNVSLDQLKSVPGGKSLYRAAAQLRLTYLHFLPLTVAHQMVGMLVLAAKEPHDIETPRGQQILNALINQAATVVANARLVADLAEREEQMKAEQAFRKMILDTMGDSLLVIDEDAIIRYANNRLLRVTGYSRDDLYGNSIGMMFSTDVRDGLVTSLKRQGRSTVNFYQQLITKDGRVVPVLMSRATAVSSSISDYSTVLVLTDLTEQKRREQALERQSKQLRALNRAAQAITSALTLDDVIAILLHSAAEVVQCTNACLFLRDDRESEVFTVVSAIGPEAETLRQTSVRAEEGIVGRVVHEQKAQLVPLVEGDRQLSPQPDYATDSVIAVPLVIMDQVIGVLEAINKIDGQFAPDDMEYLENLAAAAAVAIENARLFEQTQRRVGELSTLLEASAAASSTLEIGSVLELITRRLAEVLHVARCSIATWERSGNQLIVLAETCNASWELGRGPSRPAIKSQLATLVLQSGRSALAHINDLSLDATLRDAMNRLGMSSILLVPLRIGQALTGIVELYSSRDRAAFAPQYIQDIEDSVSQWREQVRKRGAGEWYDADNLTDLYQRVIRVSDAPWFVVSSWHRLDRTTFTLREIGFALWQEKASQVYALEDYPTMAASLGQGLPMTLYPPLLRDDPNEGQLLAEAGTPSGLIIPLLVRGEASGLVKLSDVAQGRDFDLAEISLCQGIANVVGSAIENAQLYRSLERRANALQAAYNDLRQADELKNTLIQNLSHELQTPLHQTIMQLDLLANDVFGPTNDEQKENMQAAITRITQIGDLVRNMMSLHTLDTQKGAFTEVRLEEVILDSIQNTMAKAAQAGLKMIPRWPQNLSAVLGDGKQLTEAFDQLLDNAIKFSPPGERKADRIDVRVEDNGSATVHVSVQDYGIGIPEAEFDRIFQSGYQVDGSITRRFGGTGLGLALVRRIIETHGGKIWVESKVGTGSVFHFTIPKSGVKSPVQA